MKVFRFVWFVCLVIDFANVSQAETSLHVGGEIISGPKDPS